MTELKLDPQTTALVLIDLQQGIASRPLQPHTAADVVSRGAELARQFRAARAPVVLVHVDFTAGRVDFPQGKTDESMHGAGSPDWAKFVPEVGPEPTDLILTKRQWGAFYGTELDLQLRRRSVRTIVLGGIATNFGVESTARAAWEHNYNVVFVEDAMTTMSAEMHAFAIKFIFPRLGQIRSTADVLAALKP